MKSAISWICTSHVNFAWWRESSCKYVSLLTFKVCSVSFSFNPFRKCPRCLNVILFSDISRVCNVWFLARCVPKTRLPSSASPFHDISNSSTSTLACNGKIKSKMHFIFRTSGQRPVELMWYPFIRRPAVHPSVCLSVCLSVNNMLFLCLHCN